jgi:hypothetical protein
MMCIIDLVRESSSETQSSLRAKHKVANAGRNGGVIHVSNDTCYRTSMDQSGRTQKRNNWYTRIISKIKEATDGSKKH